MSIAVVISRSLKSSRLASCKKAALARTWVPRVRVISCSLQQLHTGCKYNYCSNKYESLFDVDTNVKEPVLLYSNDSYVFHLLNYFIVVQLSGWILGIYCILRATEIAEPGQLMLFNLVDPCQPKWRYGITTAFAVAGTLMTLVPFLYASKSVRQLILLPGGKAITIQTFGLLFTRNTSRTIPLSKVNCIRSRETSGNYIAVREEGKRTYFLLDKLTGKLHHPHLFDMTAGMQRFPK